MTLAFLYIKNIGLNACYFDILLGIDHLFLCSYSNKGNNKAVLGIKLT